MTPILYYGRLTQMKAAIKKYKKKVNKIKNHNKTILRKTVSLNEVPKSRVT